MYICNQIYFSLGSEEDFWRPKSSEHMLKATVYFKAHDLGLCEKIRGCLSTEKAFRNVELFPISDFTDTNLAFVVNVFTWQKV